MAFTAKTDARVAVMMADGCEEIEALTVCDVLWRAGIPCDKVSINSGLEVESAHGLRFSCDTTLAQANADDYAMIVLPGGLPGTTNLEACKPLRSALESFADDGRWIAAICAAPSILAHMGLLEGLHATAYPAYHAELAECGAVLEADATAVVDDNIITSQGMGTALDFSYAIVSELLDDQTAQAVANSIVDVI